MNIWLVSLFDPTPLDEPIYPRFVEIAKAANLKGHDVHHFTSTFRHTTKSQRFEETKSHAISEAYTVHFVKSMGYQNNFSPKRFYAHYDFAKNLIKKFKQFSNLPDVIFISMPPLSTIKIVTKWAEFQKIAVVIDVIDPWPDSFIKDVPASLKPLSRVLVSPFTKLLRKAFDKATAITAISNGYLKWASNYHSNKKLTSPFFLAINLDEVQASIQNIAKGRSHTGKFRFIYAGSMASSYDIPCILNAAELLDKNHPGITEFVFTGKGPQVKLVHEYEQRLNNVKYLGWLSKEQLLEEYGKADFGLIQHKNSLTQTITYKFFNYMSAGLVLLNSLQTEMAEMIVEYKLGKNNLEMDHEGLYYNIVSYLNNPEHLENQRRNVIEFTRKYGHVNNVYGSLVDFLINVSSKVNSQ